jgi:hypothetical protein
MSKLPEGLKITIKAEGIERFLRRAIAAKEMIDAAIEAGAELLAAARPNGSPAPNKESMPATFLDRLARYSTSRGFRQWPLLKAMQ